MAIDSKTHFTNVENFYKFLTPVDLYGKSKPIDKKHTVTLEKEVYEHYMLGTYSGEDIVNNIKKLNIPGKGVYFNTVFEPAKSQAGPVYLYPDYFKTITADNLKNSDSLASIAPPASFYKQVCRNDDSDPQECPLDFSINLMRSAYLGMERTKGSSILPFGVRNCDAVEFFLNYMPSIFPSRMIPYFEVEFDFPKTLPGTQTSALSYNFLNRPSLLRFLLGSVDLSNVPLTAADKSLVYSKKVITRGNKLEEAYNAGMELFTTPQTLVNMSGLQAAFSPRFVDAKPFLPPATLTGGSVNMMNGGAEAFVHMKGQIQMVIHDKARLAEFSEFFRVAQGTQDLIVWLTYGWIAPRGDEENDAYARFINQTMLKKVAFNIMNVSFSIEGSGQANVTVDLVQQGKSYIDTVQLGSSENNFFRAIRSLKDSAAAVEKAKIAVNELESFYQGFKVVKDVKTGLDSFDPKTASDKEKNDIQNLLTQVNNATYLPVETKNSLKDGLDAAKLMADYADKKLNKLRAAARTYMKKNFEGCMKINSLDPFLPERYKQKLSVPENGGNKEYVIYKDELLSEIDQMNRPPKVINTKDKKTSKPRDKGTKRIVSFGKIFSSFCLPPLLNMGKTQGVEEIQVNFYQLNESCGYLALQNIAEIPVDMDMMMELFSISAEQSGGEVMTLRNFVKIFNMSYLQDNRALGYGLTTLYEGFTIETPEEKSRSDKGFDFEKSRKAWADKYGILRVPNLQIKLETTPKRTSASYVDMLEQVRNPSENIAGAIMKIHIYDANMNPYDNAKLTILKNSAGAYLGLPQEMVTPELQKVEYDKATQTGKIGDVQVISSDPTTNPLVEFVRNTVPTLTVGANGSLINSISFASKTDGALATALAVSAAKNGTAANTLSPNGLRMAANNLPLRITDSNVSMSTLGCPIADLYQHFYIDFGTGTTLDNIYAATGVNHSFSPGKFETSWTMLPVDGYSRFAGAQPVAKALDDIEKEKASEEKGNPGNNKAAPPPKAGGTGGSGGGAKSGSTSSSGGGGSGGSPASGNAKPTTQKTVPAQAAPPAAKPPPASTAARNAANPYITTGALPTPAPIPDAFGNVGGSTVGPPPPAPPPTQEQIEAAELELRRSAGIVD